MRETDIRFPCGDLLLGGIYFYWLALLAEAAEAFLIRNTQRKGVY